MSTSGIRIGVPTSSLTRHTVPGGFYKVRLAGFRPAATIKKDSTNLNARFVVVSMAPDLQSLDITTFAGQKTIPDGPPAKITVDGKEEDAKGTAIFAGLNTKAGFILEAATHSLGQEMAIDVDPVTGDTYSNIPGTFAVVNPSDPPEKWGAYSGPLLDCEAIIEVIESESMKKNPTTGLLEPTGQMRNEVKQFVCRLPKCDVKHSNNLIKS